MDPMLGVDKSKKPLKIVWIGVLFIIIAAAIIWYFVSVYPKQHQVSKQAAQVAEQLEQQQRTAEAVDTVVSPPALSTENVAPKTNPVEERVPEINPVERANPFAEEFENPFE